MSEQDGTGLEQGGPASASPRDNNSKRQGITMEVVPCLLLFFIEYGILSSTIQKLAW